MLLLVRKDILIKGEIPLLPYRNYSDPTLLSHQLKKIIRVQYQRYAKVQKTASALKLRGDMSNVG